jgi:predicted Ser/Thr protein kinase
MNTIAEFSLKELREHTVDVFRKGQGTRPDVLLIEVAGVRAVLKDQNACDRWFAMFVGPLLVWREARALDRLKGVSGIPVLLARPDARSILIEFADAVEAKSYPHMDDWRVWFDKLEKLIQRMHEVGIAHGDLRSPGNILIDKNADPVLVDFVASCGEGSRWNIFANAVFRGLCAVDDSAVLKLKSRMAPGLLSDRTASTHVGGKPGLVLRAIGQAVRRLSRMMFTSK